MTDESMPDHWMADRRTRNAFWAFAGNLGLTDGQTREALGLERDEEGEWASTYTYDGTFEDAQQALAEYADYHRSLSSAALVRMAHEAPSIIYTQGISKQGWELNCTVRGATVSDAVDEFGRLVRLLKAMGVEPLVRDRWAQTLPPQAPAQTPVNESSPHSAPLPRPAPPQQSYAASPPAQQPPAPQENGYTNVKVGNVTQIEVRPDGQIQVHSDALKWPLKDSRGAEVVSGLFSDDCWSQEFPPAALSLPGWYKPGGLVVQYGKNTRGYWDIIAVRKAS